MIKQTSFTIAGAKGRNMLMDLTFDDARPAAPLVVFVHGFKGFKDWGTHNLLARYFVGQGFRFLKFNFSHNGTTPQNPVDFVDLIAFSDNTFSIELEDLGYVIDFACNGAAIPAANKVYLIGHSLGGGISIIKAAEDKRVAKLVTFASVANFRNLWPAAAEAQWKLQKVMYVANARTGQQMPLKISLLADLEQNPARLDILAKAKLITQPWLITHGDADESVTLSHAQQLAEVNPTASLFVLPGANHVYGAAHPAATDTLPTDLLRFCESSVDFLKK